MANEQDIINIENYYADLLIIQYRNKPKARATIKLGADIYMADGLLLDFENVLDIDTAKGAQLDLIGKILGCNRNIPGMTVNKPFFSYEKVNAYGYSDVNDVSEGYWKNYFNSTGTSYALPDDVYRIVLKFKALYNVRNAGMGYYYDMFYRIFGNEITITNDAANLNIIYEVPTSHSLALQTVIYLDYIAAPLGINYTVTYT